MNDANMNDNPKAQTIFVHIIVNVNFKYML
jgi:hypothetical protein